MGNQTTKQYGQVPTIDDEFTADNKFRPLGDVSDKSSSNSMNSDNQDKGGNLMFVFHSTEEDCNDRVVHDNDPADSENDSSSFTITDVTNDDVIASRTSDSSDLMTVDEILPLLAAGDLIEIVTSQCVGEWAVFVGDNSCVRLLPSGGAVEKCWVRDAANNSLKVRLVNDIYNLKKLPVVQVLNNATQQIGKKSLWSNSECFAVWCKTGLPQLTSCEQLEIKDLDTNRRASYKLRLKTGSQEMTKNFESLSKLIDLKRKIETSAYVK